MEWCKIERSSERERAKKVKWKGREGNARRQWHEEWGKKERDFHSPLF